MDLPGALIVLSGSLLLGLVLSLLFVFRGRRNKHKNAIKSGIITGFGIALALWVGLVLLGILENSVS